MVPPDAVDVVEVMRGLVARGDVIEAKRIATRSLAEKGPNVELLQEVAAIEDKQGEYSAAADHLVDALKLRQSDIQLARSCTKALYKSERYSEARSVVLEFPCELRRDPHIRAVLGDVYRAIGWHAHAVDAYGSLRDLEGRSRYLCALSWLNCGMPLHLHRSRQWNLECRIERSWSRKSAERRNVLHSLDIRKPDPARVSADLDSLLLRQLLVQHWLDRYDRATSNLWWWYGYLVLAWFVAQPLLGYSQPGESLGSLVVPAILIAEIATAITLVLYAPVKRNMSEASHVRFIKRIWLGMLIVGVALITLGRTSWPGVVGVLALDIVLTSYLLMNSYYEFLAEDVNTRRKQPREFVLGNLLDLLNKVGGLDERNDFAERRRWMAVLEDCAWVVERCFPTYLKSRDSVIRRWVVGGARDAAAAVRMAACLIAMPGENTWDLLMTGLRHNTKAIVTGNFGALQPQSDSFPSQVHLHQRRVLANVLRWIILLAFLAVISIAAVVLRDQSIIRGAAAQTIAGMIILVLGLLIAPLGKQI